jgi:hypothetical protein
MQASTLCLIKTAMRQADITRNTLETQIRVVVDLDGTGASKLCPRAVGFFDHMLDQIARHGMIDLTVEAKGDLHIDAHHTIEDVGITHRPSPGQGLGRQEGPAPLRPCLRAAGRSACRASWSTFPAARGWCSTCPSRGRR